MGLSVDERKELIIHLVRDESTLRAAESRLSFDLFYDNEVIDSLFWEVSLENYRKIHMLTPKEQFRLSVMRKIDDRRIDIDKALVDTWINEIFSRDESTLNHAFVVNILSEFILERRVGDRIRSLLDSNEDLSTVVEDLHKASLSSKISSAKATDLSALGLDVFAGLKRIDSGCLPLNKILDGGVRPKETYGILGPMKGGKTAFCQTIACDWLTVKSDPPRKVTYVTYEESAEQLWPKFLVCSANKWPGSYLDGKSLKDFPADVAEKLTRHGNLLSNGLNLIDMAGSKNQGFGGLNELIATLESEHKAGTLGQLVIIDHLLPLANLELGAKGLSPDGNLRHTVQNICQTFVNCMSRFGTTGILAHQMDGSGNKKNSHYKPSHMDSSENKLFGQYLHAIMCLGTKDETSGVAYLNLSATRNTQAKYIQVIVDGAYRRIRLANNYHEDGSGGFISDDEVRNGRLATNEIDGNLSFPSRRDLDSIPSPFDGADSGGF